MRKYQRLINDPTLHVGVYAQISRQADWIISTICADHSSPLPDFCSTDETDNTDLPPPPVGECFDFSWKDAYGDDCSWSVFSPSIVHFSNYFYPKLYVRAYIFLFPRW